MKIGYDGKRAVSNNTGLGNYSRLVIEETALRHSSDTLSVYTPRMSDNPRLARIEKMNNVYFVTPSHRPGGALWRTWGITAQLAADQVEIYHGLSNELPLNIRKSGIPSVVTMHDVIYRTVPECYSPIDRKIYDLKYGHACRVADRIIAISECTKRDVMHFYGISEDKIDVVYQGCHPSFREEWPDSELNELRRRLNLPERYIVQVGTIENRKNLMLTVRALSAVNRDIKLVAIGRLRGNYKEKVEREASLLGVADRVIFMQNVDFADLPGVYRNAEVIVYPSRYEGFGLPVLEGLESRRPVVAATGSCLEEAGGDAALYVHPDDSRAMAQAINALTDGSVDIKAMSARGVRHAARFSTDIMVDKIYNIYSRMIADFQNSKIK